MNIGILQFPIRVFFPVVKKLFALAGLTVTCMLGCKPITSPNAYDKTEQGAEVQGVAEGRAGWQKRRIKVCWARSNEGKVFVNSFFPHLKLNKNESSFSSESANALFGTKGTVVDFSADEKSLMIAAVNSNFVSGKAPVEFFGWQMCGWNEKNKSESTQSDLILLRGQNLDNYASSVGQTFVDGLFRIPNKSDKKIAIVTSFGDECKQTKLIKDCVTGIFLHELGHVLGLRHEDVHPDANSDPMCSVTYDTGLPRAESDQKPSERLGPAVILTAYDKESLMNRCHLFARLRGDKRSKIGALKFSSGDMRAIKSLLSEKKPNF